MADKKTTKPELADEIIVNNIEDIRPKELPLVVELPKDASKAQIAFAKTINTYAYANRDKWLEKQDVLIAKLKSLKNAPDPIEGNLKINGTFL